MNELDKLQTAKEFIDKMAQGINPLTGQGVSESDLIAEEKMSKFFSYMSGVLQQMIDTMPNDLQVKVGYVVTLLNCETGEMMRHKILSSYDTARYATMGYRTKKYVEFTRISDADGIESISDESPLGKAIIGKQAGDAVRIKIDDIVSVYRIMHVSDS